MGNLLNMDATASSPTSIFWRSCAPPRVQFFGWLLIHDRVQSKANLHKKKILEDAVCDLCGCTAETTAHMMFGCSVASSFWRAIGVQVPAGFEISSLHEIPKPPQVPCAHFEMLILLCCWQLWKRRNGTSAHSADVQVHCI